MMNFCFTPSPTTTHELTVQLLTKTLKTQFHHSFHHTSNSPLNSKMGLNLFQYGVVAFLAILGRTAARDLRPSDHGLSYQEHSLPPTQNGDVQQMRSFFGSSVQLPEAKNISDTWIAAHADGTARDVGKDHVSVRVGLLVASAACGLTGVVLLAISGVVLVYRLQKQRTKAAEGVPATSAFTSLPQSHAINKNGG